MLMTIGTTSNCAAMHDGGARQLLRYWRCFMAGKLPSLEPVKRANILGGGGKVERMPPPPTILLSWNNYHRQTDWQERNPQDCWCLLSHTHTHILSEAQASPFTSCHHRTMSHVTLETQSHIPVFVLLFLPRKRPLYSAGVIFSERFQCWRPCAGQLFPPPPP